MVHRSSFLFDNFTPPHIIPTKGGTYTMEYPCPNPSLYIGDTSTASLLYNIRYLPIKVKIGESQNYTFLISFNPKTYAILS